MAGSEPERLSVIRLCELGSVADERKLRSRHIMIKSPAAALSSYPVFSEEFSHPLQEGSWRNQT